MPQPAVGERAGLVDTGPVERLAGGPQAGPRGRRVGPASRGLAAVHGDGAGRGRRRRAGRQDVGHPAVHARPLDRAQVGQQHLADQVVRHPHPARGRLDQQPRAQRRRHPAVVAGRDGGQQADRHVPAGDRGRGEHVPRGRGQARQTQPDDVADPGRHSLPGRRRQRGQLGDEERVAAGALGQRGGDRAAARAAAQLRDQVGDLAGRQPGQPQPARARQPGGQPEHPGERRVAGGLLAAGRRQQQPAAVQLGEDHLEHVQRVAVGPLQVVEDDEQRPLGGEGVQPAGGVQAEGEPGAGVGAERRLGQPAEHLLPRPVRRRAADLGAAAPADGGPGAGGERLDQPGLADARLPGDDDRGAAAGARRRPGARQRGQLLRPAHEAVAGRCGDGCRRGRRGACRGGQRGVLAQHGGLEVAQLGRGVQAQLVGDPLAGAAQHVERVGLAAGPVQRPCQQRGGVLAQRGDGGGRGEVGDELGAGPQRQPRPGQPLDGDQPQLLQPRDHRDDVPNVGDVGVGPVLPAGQRLGQQPGGRAVVRGRAGGDQVGEGVRVDGGARQDQGVAVAAGHQDGGVAGPAARVEEPAQAADVALQRRRRRGRRGAAPEAVGQRGGRHRTALGGGQQRQDLGGPAPAEVQVDAVAQQPRRPEHVQPQVHGDGG
nr:hypothetical protein [Geodermatophilus amargosae]